MLFKNILFLKVTEKNINVFECICETFLTTEFEESLCSAQVFVSASLHIIYELIPAASVGEHCAQLSK